MYMYILCTFMLMMAISQQVVVKCLKEGLPFFINKSTVWTSPASWSHGPHVAEETARQRQDLHNVSPC